MCGRFWVAPDDAPEALAALLHEAENRARVARAGFSLRRGELRPGDDAAVIALNRRMSPSAFVMRWGFRMDTRLIFNARSESAMSKPLFRDSFRQRRCLIPASAYFEWDHRQEHKTKMMIWPAGTKMMMLCGLYRVEDDPRFPAFTILTREASETIAAFHPRMPVILPWGAAMQWLQPDADPQALLDMAAQDMAFRPADAPAKLSDGSE